VEVLGEEEKGGKRMEDPTTLGNKSTPMTTCVISHGIWHM